MTHDFEISLLFGKFLWIADFKGKKKLSKTDGLTTFQYIKPSEVLAVFPCLFYPPFQNTSHLIIQ